MVLEGYDRIQDFKNKMGEIDPKLLKKMDNMDPTKMDLGAILDQGQLGLEMLKNADDAIKSLNNPMIDEARKSLGGDEIMGMASKISEKLDINEIKDKADQLNKGMEGLFNLFQ